MGKLVEINSMTVMVEVSICAAHERCLHCAAWKHGWVPHPLKIDVLF